MLLYSNIKRFFNLILEIAFASEGEIILVILFDILYLLLISSNIIEGVTDLCYIARKKVYSLNLVSGTGIDSWVII